MIDLQANDASESMSTLSECMNMALARGYKAELMVSTDGLHAAGKERLYKPDEVHIHNFYRFEGESSPDDMAILYLIETTDGTKGTLVDAYGTYADAKINDFIKAVQDIHK